MRRGQRRQPDAGPTPAERALELAESANASVTALRPVRNDPSRLNVFVDRHRVARVHADDVGTLDLRIGRAWTPELADAVNAASDRCAAHRRALNVLGYRARTRAELARRLSRSGHARDSIDAVLDRLEAAGLLDDAQLARRAAESEVARKPAGPRLLEAKLRARGIDASTARDAARDATADRDLAADAYTFAERRYRSMPPGLPRDAVRRRLYAALARRGFDPETCRSVLERLEADPPPPRTGPYTGS